SSTFPTETIRHSSPCLFTITHTLSLVFTSQNPTRLIFVTHRDDILSIPAQQRAPTGGACWRSGERRLRVRPRQPGLRGPRESPPGPTTWGRPQGLVERMNAGRKSLRDQGDLENGSFRFQKAVSRLKENAAVERR